MNEKFVLFAICFVIVGLVAKIIGCGLMSKGCGFTWGDSLKIGVGMMTRGEVCLIVAQKGLNAGFLSGDFFSAVILLILFSSVATPTILKSYTRKCRRQKILQRHPDFPFTKTGRCAISCTAPCFFVSTGKF